MMTREQKPTYDELEQALIVRDREIAALRARVEELEKDCIAYRSAAIDCGTKLNKQIDALTAERDEAVRMMQGVMRELKIEKQSLTQATEREARLVEALKIGLAIAEAGGSWSDIGRTRSEEFITKAQAALKS